MQDYEQVRIEKWGRRHWAVYDGPELICIALYKIGADPARYSNDFFDVTTGDNQADPSVPGYPATTGWDPVTGLGTPNAANLVPDLVSAAHGN